jgi:TRAP-type C4-dicarboxylate transport system substrate-binding protein
LSPSSHLHTAQNGLTALGYVAIGVTYCCNGAMIITMRSQKEVLVMRKKKISVIATGFLCIGIMLAVSAFEAAYAKPKVITLTYANYFPPTHQMSKLQEQFCSEIAKRTNGRVKITYHPGGAILKATRIYDGVVTGLADIGYSHCGYTRGRFIITEVLALPLGYPSGWVATHVANDFYNEFKPKEWDETHMLYLHNGCAGCIHSTKPVRTLEDLKGVTIRAPGAVGDTLRALGGTPRDLPMSEVYEGISKNVINGSMTSMECAKGWKFAEVCKYLIDCWQISHVHPFYVVMNKDKWNKLPQDIKKIFTEVSEEWIDKAGKTWDAANAEGAEYTLSLGNEIIRLTAEEAARWQKAVEPLTDAYIKKIAAKGFSAEEQKEHVNFIKERVKYWTKKQVELGIKSPTGPQEIRE